MQFKCSQQILSKSINIISKAITNRTTLPILKGILLEVTNDNVLKMCASDLDITIEHKIQIEEGIPGKTVIPARLFSDIIRKLPSSEIVLEEEYDNIKIRANNSEFNVIGMKAEEFPHIISINKDKDENDSIEIKPDLFKNIINKTAFAANPDLGKGILSGVLVYFKNDSLEMVAVDGFRMAINKFNMVNVKEKKAIISSKILVELSKIIGESNLDCNCFVSINEKLMEVNLENTRVSIRLMEGDFIDYENIVPKSSKISIIINTKDFANSIERASLLKEGNNNLIRLNFTDKVLTITSKSEEGNVKEELLVEKEGENIEIGFNSKYILDVLKVIDDEEIRFNLNESTSPCLINQIDGDEYSYIVLPVRISGN